MLVTAAAGGVGMAAVDIASNVLKAKVTNENCSYSLLLHAHQLNAPNGPQTQSYCNSTLVK